MIILNFKYEGSSLPGVICNIVVKAHLSRPTPQMHPGIYIYNGMYWQLFLILQEKVEISFYFWIIRLVNTQLVLYSHVRCNPFHTFDTPETPLKHLHMIMTNFKYEGSYEVEISFYFWIIRFVNIQLALYSHVRCNPINSPWHPWKTPHDNYKFQLWQLQISTMRAHICQV